MTNEAWIKKAADDLVKRNKVQEDKLRNPIIHDAKVVYFEIQPGLNVMMVLDSETGERLDCHFGPNRFLKQGPGQISETAERPSL